MSDSDKKLNSFIERKIRKLFRTFLECVEMRFGDDFDGFGAIRSKVLRSGNDTIRDIKELIERKYEVKEIQGKAVFKTESKEDR